MILLRGMNRFNRVLACRDTFLTGIVREALGLARFDPSLVEGFGKDMDLAAKTANEQAGDVLVRQAGRQAGDVLGLTYVAIECYGWCVEIITALHRNRPCSAIDSNAFSLRGPRQAAGGRGQGTMHLLIVEFLLDSSAQHGRREQALLDGFIRTVRNHMFSEKPVIVLLGMFGTILRKCL